MATSKKPPPKKGSSGGGQRNLLVGGVVAAAAYLLWRHQKATAGTVHGTATTTGNNSTLTAPTPQTPMLVPSGEQIYDPNTQQLLGGSGTGTSPTGPSPNATAPSAPSYSINVRYPRTPIVKRTGKKPATRAVRPKAYKTPGRPVKSVNAFAQRKLT